MLLQRVEHLVERLLAVLPLALLKPLEYVRLKLAHQVNPRQERIERRTTCGAPDDPPAGGRRMERWAVLEAHRGRGWLRVALLEPGRLGDKQLAHVLAERLQVGRALPEGL